MDDQQIDNYLNAHKWAVRGLALIVFVIILCALVPILAAVDPLILP